MDQSSFISNSSQYKKRKPIFSKDDNSPVSKLTDHLSKNSSSVLLHNRNIPINNNQTYSHFTAQPQQNKMNICIPSSHPRPQISYSQPKINVQQNNPHVIYHQRPSTPVIAQNLMPQKILHSNPQQMYPQEIRPQFYQTQKLPTTILKRSYQPKQNFSRIERPINSEVKQNIRITVYQPQPISVERISKQIGSNKLQKQITYLQNPNQYSYTLTDPYSSRFGKSNDHNSDNQISKLQEINGLLSQNYNLLYNQFFNLKKDIREEEVVEEHTFLKNSMNKIEHIFNMQTNQALNQIEQLYNRKRYPMRKIDNYI